METIKKKSNKSYKERVEILIKMWNKINSISDWNIWADYVSNESFGTYGTITIFEVIENTKITFITSLHKFSFENEVKDALNGFRHK